MHIVSIKYKLCAIMQGPDSHEHYVLVTAKASGVVAKPGVKDREAVLFNIGNILMIIFSFSIPIQKSCFSFEFSLCKMIRYIYILINNSIFLFRNLNCKIIFPNLVS